MHRIGTLKKEFDTAAELKKRIEAAEYVVSIIEDQIRDTISSPDFDKLTEEDVQLLIISKARAVKFWRSRIEFFTDENIIAWVNSVARIESKELEMSVEDVMEIYGRPGQAVPEFKVEPKSEPELTPEKTEEDDILEQLLAES